MILREAGLAQVNTFGVQAYLPPQDQAGPALLGGVVRSLAPVIVERGIATAEQWGSRRWRAVSPRSSNGQTRCCYRRPWSVPGESPPRFDPCHARNVLLLDQGKTLASGLKLRVAMVSLESGKLHSSTNTDASSTTARR